MNNVINWMKFKVNIKPKHEEMDCECGWECMCVCVCVFISQLDTESGLQRTVFFLIV